MDVNKYQLPEVAELRKEIKQAYSYLKSNELYRRTKTEEANGLLQELVLSSSTTKLTERDIQLILKDETSQTSGSFKIRGLLNQVKPLVEQCDVNVLVKLVCFSAGNYGRAFAEMCKLNQFQGVVVMPDFSPLQRSQYIESLGVSVIRCKNNEIDKHLERLVKQEHYTLLHPYDDLKLIYGHASFGLEMLEDCVRIDVAIVCCGGGGILAGTALALKLFGDGDCSIIGVEPENADTMRQSLQQKCPISKPDSSSIASGLSPPSAGRWTYAICEKYVDQVVTVSDQELIQAMSILHCWGYQAEPSGSAAFAAVLFNKIEWNAYTRPDGKAINVVVGITGGNCSTEDLRLVRTDLNTQ